MAAGDEANRGFFFINSFLNKSFRYRLSFFACIYCTTSSVPLLLNLKPPFYAVS